MTRIRLRQRAAAACRLALVAAPVLLSMSDFSTAHAIGMPSRDALLQARLHVSAAAAQVAAVVTRIHGGQGDRMPGGEPSEGPWRGGDREGGHPGWPRLEATGDASEIAAADGEVLENDHAAEFALLGLSSGLNDLGQRIDQATAAYGTPAFFGFLVSACIKDAELIPATNAGKVAAAIPFQVLVHPFDFDPILQELFATKSMLMCL